MNTTTEKQNFFLKVSTFLNLWRLRKSKKKKVKKVLSFCGGIFVKISKYQEICKILISRYQNITKSGFS